MRRISQHGTRGRYVMGCRCLPCTDANRDYQRDYLRERVRRGITDGHGKVIVRGR